MMMMMTNFKKCGIYGDDDDDGEDDDGYDDDGDK
jgi:hypothetical protein